MDDTASGLVMRCNACGSAMRAHTRHQVADFIDEHERHCDRFDIGSGTLDAILDLPPY